MGQGGRIERAYRAATEALGTLVLVVALTALLFLVLEGAARLVTGEATVRVTGRQVTPTDVAMSDLATSEVYRGYPWIKEFEAARAAADDGGLQYEPFLLWRHKPYRSRFVNFDERGLRLTVNPEKPAAAREWRVLVLGGSTMAGDGYVRDQDTFASRLSARLNEALAEVRVVVTNGGQSGYGQDNEIAMLQKLLREGYRPDLVLFCDGPNDVSHLISAEVPHMAYHAFRSATASPVRRVAMGALKRSVLLRRLLDLEPPVLQGLVDEPARIEDNVAPMLQHYLGNYRVIRALAQGDGFDFLVVWQPTLYSTRKPLSEGEAALLKRVDERYPFIGLSYRLANRALAEALAGGQYPNLVDHSAEPVGLARPVFGDIAHLSPDGYDALAGAVVEELRRRGMLAR